MSLGKGNKSIIRETSTTERIPSVGFKKLVFWHQAAEGDTTINLNGGLVMPVDISALGKTNPTLADISSALLTKYPENLTLTSYQNGPVLPGKWTPTTNYLITLATPALAGEIFIGVMDYVAKSGAYLTDIAYRAERADNTLMDNHFGSPTAANDRSVAGLGFYLRRPDGTLREVALDDNDNLIILSV